MININYNLKRHIELLKQEKKILNEKKSFLKENPKEALELIKYNVKVSQHIEWEDRFEIASVMEDFLSKKINAPKLKGFLSALYFECEHFETNFDEAELYTSIENGFFKFQIILNEE